MAESDFSWRKILSFFGAGILVFIAFVTVAAGIKLIILHHSFYGVITIISGLVAAADVVLIYRNYEKRSAEQAKNEKPNYQR